MNRVAAVAANVPRTCIRRISSTEARCDKTQLDNIRKKQLHFQTDNDVPVYIKGGAGDYILYYGSLALALKFLNCGKRALRVANHNALRMSSTDEPCSTKPPDPCPQNKQQPQQQPDPCACMKGESPPKQEGPCPTVPQHEPCPPKPDPMPKPPPPSATKCTTPPPCPSMPRCPAAFCPHLVDRNNPCNYCPPPCIDPDYPDMTRIKKYQCLFQHDDGLPVYLKRGNLDAFVYQTTLLLVLIGVIAATYSTIKLIMK